LDATWTHNIATKETFEGNKNGTVSSPKNAATVHIEPVLYATKLNVPTNKANFHVLECYFIGKRSVFPVVKLYIQNAWGKYGILKVTMNAKGFFFFKFLSLQGAKSMLQDGSWMIRGIPIFLNKWLPSVSLTKEDTSKVPVWIKMHDVPLAAYTSDGLSMIATKLCKPMILDSYTNTMCLESWSRSSYARAMVEVNAKKYIIKEMVVAVVRAEKVVEQNVDQDETRSNNDGSSTSTNTNATKKNDGTFIVNIPTSNPYAALGAEYEHNKDKENGVGFREGISLMNEGARRRKMKWKMSLISQLYLCPIKGIAKILTSILVLLILLLDG
ncbi:zinc knuckle CX2CX4HX4C containing protein, partial [Tanacetum coccineum]